MKLTLRHLKQYEFKPTLPVSNNVHYICITVCAFSVDTNNAHLTRIKYALLWTGLKCALPLTDLDIGKRSHYLSLPVVVHLLQGILAVTEGMDQVRLDSLT